MTNHLKFHCLIKKIYVYSSAGQAFETVFSNSQLMVTPSISLPFWHLYPDHLGYDTLLLFLDAQFIWFNSNSHFPDYGK
jgi:hypothetical protein